MYVQPKTPSKSFELDYTKILRKKVHTFTIRTSESGGAAVDVSNGRSVFVKTNGEKWLSMRYELETRRSKRLILLDSYDFLNSSRAHFKIRDSPALKSDMSGFWTNIYESKRTRQRY